MAITTRLCLWCGSEMECHRNTKYLCANKCHVALHRYRQKNNLNTDVIFIHIEALIADHQHPNKQYSYYQKE